MIIKKSKGLGRGLEALLGDVEIDAASGAGSGQPLLLPLAQLQPGTYQPRTKMDDGSLRELAASIKTQGIIQPILVRKVASEHDLKQTYEIIAGERRFRAAQLAGLKEIPVFIKDVDNQSTAVIALIENIQRENLNPLEEAQGINRLILEFNFTHEQVASAIGRSRSAVSNLLRLLNLAQPVQTMLMAGDIDMGHARALLTVDEATQIMFSNQIAAKKMSVRETEKLVARTITQSENKTRKEKHKKTSDIAQLEDELSDLLAMPVTIKVNAKNEGQFVIHFVSLDALDSVITKLRT